MDIKVRPTETPFRLELKKSQALDLYVFLTDFYDQAATPEIAETVEQCRKQAKEFLLGRNYVD